MVAEAKAQLGKPYDPKFGWGDEAMYCSELVYKAYERGAGVTVGKKQRIDELDLSLIGPALKARYGAAIPLDRLLVTPASIGADPQLSWVYSDF